MMRLHEITDNFKGIMNIILIEMLDVLSQLSKLDYELNDNDLELLTRCFKNFIGIKRNQYRKIDAIIERDNINSKLSRKTITYKFDLFNLKIYTI